MHPWFLVPLLGLSLGAQTPQKPRAGAFEHASIHAPIVTEARQYIQKHFALLRIEHVTEASTQVVAGMNVRLVARVKEEEGEGTWEFQAYRQLDGRWRLQLAKRISD